MKFLNIPCPPLPYYIVGGKCIYRPGDIHERRVIHNAFDLIYVHTGHLYLEQNDWEVELGEGQFFIIIPEIYHRGKRICTEKTITSWVHFFTDSEYTLSENFYPDCITRRATPKYYYSPQEFVLSLPRTWTVSEADRPNFERCLKRLLLVSFNQYTKKKEFPSHMQTPLDLQSVLIQLLQALYTPLCSDYEKQSIARTLRDYIDLHYMEDISLNNMAKFFSYSSSHLIRCFNQAYQVSPMQYLKKLRIKKAAQLLLSSDSSIHEIGEKVGLSTSSYFIREFKKETGMTPVQYRTAYMAEGNADIGADVNIDVNTEIHADADDT